MIRIEKNKLIIEITSSSPAEDLKDIRESIISAIVNCDTHIIKGNPVRHLMYLLQAMEFNASQFHRLMSTMYDDTKKIAEFNNLADK